VSTCTGFDVNITEETKLMSGQTQEGGNTPAEIELQIANLKKEIDDTLTRFYSSSSKGPTEMWNMRMHLAKISLQNCQAIAKYVKSVSSPVAKELESSRRSVTRKLAAVEKSKDLAKLNDWYKRELGPLLTKAEQTAYLIASSLNKKTSGDEEGQQFKWRLDEPPGGQEHVRLYGKTADQFTYLDQVCPICGGRIDEMGWCGCGTTGGG
jgi:hypothetical protein